MGLKTHITTAIDFVIKGLIYIKNELLKEKCVLEISHYEDLTPTLIEEKNYSDAIKWALNNKKIKNIALTGTYGSGKSSILYTFQNAYKKEYSYLNISLATFNIGRDDNLEDKINLIEQSILQQMIYHVKDKLIPDSRFKRIKNLKTNKLYLLSSLMVVWVLSLIIVLLPESLCLYTWLSYFYDNWYQTLRNTSLFIIVFGAIYFLASFIRIMYNSQFNKFNIKSGEFEISPKLDSSILNKHLDEILYFFEVTDFNVVIIEDLDRFQSVEIFTKLREINILINSSKQINRHITFIYAIKDDMFGKNESRTKFFDFIIPVIPVINSSNSLEIFADKLKKANINIEDNFLSEITLFIDDMRLLKNIFNEFILYKEKLGGIDININKLLGVIIYKNLYPDDFSLLHKNEGLVYNAFDEKPNLISSATTEIDDEIEKINDEIEKIEKTQTESIEELRALFISFLIKKIPENAIALKINSKRYNFNSLNSEEVFNLLLSVNNIEYYFISSGYDGQYTNATNISFSSILDKEKRNYKTRETIIKNGKSIELEKLRLSIEKLNSTKRELKSYSLSELLNLQKHSFFLSEEISIEKLLVYLLRYGYIDEMYYSYISFFYEGSIAKTDMDFVFSIKNKFALNFNFELKKVPEVIKKIRPTEFNNIEILNYSLLDYLLENLSYSGELSSILNLISKSSSTSLTFLDGYIENGKHLPVFIEELCKVWKNIWEFVEISSKFSVQKKGVFLKLIIQNCNVEEIFLLNKKSLLSNYIAKNETFLTLMCNDEEKAIRVIKKLNVKFKKIQSPIGSEKIFNFIIENNYYEINESMIELIIKEKANPELHLLDSLAYMNYTTIMNSNIESLIKNVNENILEYIYSVFLIIDKNKDEVESNLIKLLNNEKIDDEGKIEIIKKQNTKITKIDSIHNGLWHNVVDKSKIVANWDNVIKYFENNELDEHIIEFLDTEENSIELAKAKLNSTLLSDSNKKMLEKILLCDEITLTNYNNLIKSNPYIYRSLDFDELEVDKVSLLIDRNKLIFNSVNYNLLKDNFDDLHIKFLEISITTFIKLYNETFKVEIKDFEAILKSSKIKIDEKILIIKLIKESLLSNDNALSSLIVAILSSSKKIEISHTFLSKALEYGKDKSLKIKVINIYFNDFNLDNITELLKSLGSPYFSITEKGKRPTIPLTQDNKTLIEHLQRKNYISSHNLDINEIRINNKKS